MQLSCALMKVSEDAGLRVETRCLRYKAARQFNRHCALLVQSNHTSNKVDDLRVKQLQL